MGRRGGESEIGRKVRRHSVAQRGGGGGKGGPCSPEVDKNQEGYLGREQSQSQARLHSSGFQHWEDKSPQLLAVNTSAG